ncbi:MAG TPA: hypothetical protein VKL21_01240 [Candidatus Methanoperedens sp.]|nr:hypothetical protein [Candidatus Methanoperedens sp.]
MLIQKILISPKVSEKIKCKHGLDPIVTKDILEGNRYIEKVGGNNYMAIGLCSTGYITVFFEYEAGIAEIKTAYKASDWQIDLYKRKRS